MSKIFVTQPSLPDLAEYNKLLQKIWNSKQITNNGKFHKQFEKALCEYLKVDYVSLFSNGTLAIIVALQALEIKGEVITTPYSFVATAHSLLWNGITPVFCDINEHDFNINPDKIEALITSKTTAILPVHVYGNPCNNEKIQKIADKHGLKVIYDAAHAFAVEKNNESILKWGDVSILSFHATKTFNTVEGGAIVTNDEKLKERIDNFKNFGFINETTVIGYGINAKMNELIAAYGLLQLKTIYKEIQKRKKNTEHYQRLISVIPGIKTYNSSTEIKHNYSYFPILINAAVYGKSRDQVYEFLKKNNVFTRRYFSPLISEFSAYKNFTSASNSSLPVASEISKQILCLPLYSDLEGLDIECIVNLLNELTHI